MKYKIRINPAVIADVQEIINYIAEDNPESASKMGDNIFSKIEKLADFPEMTAADDCGAPLWHSKTGLGLFLFLDQGVSVG